MEFVLNIQLFGSIADIITGDSPTADALEDQAKREAEEQARLEAEQKREEDYNQQLAEQQQRLDNAQAEESDVANIDTAGLEDVTGDFSESVSAEEEDDKLRKSLSTFGM